MLNKTNKGIFTSAFMLRSSHLSFGQVDNEILFSYFMRLMSCGTHHCQNLSVRKSAMAKTE